jgi:hypothetical protein
MNSVPWDHCGKGEEDDYVPCKRKERKKNVLMFHGCITKKERKKKERKKKERKENLRTLRKFERQNISNETRTGHILK